MSTLIPTASACYNLKLPPTEKDDRLNLNVRTGSASTLYNSFVFTFGGLTIGIDLNLLSVNEIVSYIQQKIVNYKSKNLGKYLSGELFYLNLIEKEWNRVIISENDPRPKPRLYHELCAINNRIYVFGGLRINDGYENQEITGDSSFKDFLIPCNDLWEFDLQTRKWTLLHNGEGYQTNPSIPKPKFCHKITTINSLSFVNRKDHYGLFIAGGKDANSDPIYENSVFDLVDGTYVGNEPIYLSSISRNDENEETKLNYIESVDKNNNINVNYYDSIIVNYIDEIEKKGLKRTEEEGIIVYTPVKQDLSETVNPLISFKIKKQIKHGKSLFLHGGMRTSGKEKIMSQTIPLNLKYPTGGFFGQNIIITGFLPNDFDISIFIFNRPTGKWSRLNVFCNHDYGSHRFWGGFVWHSHHKVVLIGNYLTSKTTSSIRYFSAMVTVSLPITNILASSELSVTRSSKSNLYNENENSSDEGNPKSTDDSSSTPEPLSEDEPMSLPPRKNSTRSRGSGKSSATISFSDYVHYAAPKANFTAIRSVFAPTAVALGRNAFDTFGDLISDFELISVNGDRVPVMLRLLMERWGRYFIRLLSKGYVESVQKFESQTDDDNRIGLVNKSSTSSSFSARNKLKSSVNVNLLSLSYDNDLVKEKADNTSSKLPGREPPHFRLPFQDNTVEHVTIPSLTESTDISRPPLAKAPSMVDPHQKSTTKRDSVSSFSSNNSLLMSQLLDIPPQLPLPMEPIPSVPATPISFKSTSRKNSSDLSSTRASIVHTLTTLRNIPSSKSPRESPFASPRASISGPSNTSTGHVDLFNSSFPNLKQPSEKPKVKSLETSPGSSDDSLLQAKDNTKKNMSNSMLITSLDLQDKDKRRPSYSSAKSDSLLTSDGTHGSLNMGGSSEFNSNSLLNFENKDIFKFTMEPSLIPRRLYLPFSTTTIRAFCEYLYTGQVGNRWLLTTALDNLVIAKFYEVPLLYDLVSEILFAIIGKKEKYVIKEGRKLKKTYLRLLKETNSEFDESLTFPLDEYEGLLDTVDDGYLDIALLKKTSNFNRNSSIISSKMKKTSSSPKKELTTDMEFKENSDDSVELANIYESANNNNSGSGFLNSSSFSNSGAENLKKHSKPSIHADSIKEDTTKTTEQGSRTLTLDQLVSSSMEVPNDAVIDDIFETAAIVADMKLILRSANSKNMNQILQDCKDELNTKIEEMKKIVEEMKEKNKQMENEKNEQTLNQKPELKPSMSSSSLASSRSFIGKMTSTEKTRSNSSFKNINLLTPFSKKSTDVNKNLEKRSTKLLKKEEKLQKEEEKRRLKESKTNPNKDLKGQTEKKEKKSLGLLSRSTKSDKASPAPSIMSATGKKHHSIFHIGHRKKEHDNSSSNSTKPKRSDSSNSLTSMGSKNSAHSKALSFLR